jgi:preprotein translocase subunit Sec61beta
MKITSEPVQGPSSAAGLVRYWDTSGGGIQITPELVLGISAFFILAEIALWYLI